MIPEANRNYLVWTRDNFGFLIVLATSESDAVKHYVEKTNTPDGSLIYCRMVCSVESKHTVRTEKVVELVIPVDDEDD